MKVFKTLMGSAFLVVVTLFAILIVLQPKASFSTFENRNLATFPMVTTEDVMDGSFTKEFESFVQDHFPFRDFWLGLNTRLQLALGKTYISDVHVTEDGLMLERVTDVESEDLQLAVDYVTDFKKLMNVPFELIFTPNKNIHLRSFYPSFVDSDAGLQRRNSFVKRAMEKGVSPIVLGELADFSDRKLYFESDHHWNNKGVYQGYVALMQSQGLTPSVSEQFELVKGEFLGSLNRKLFGIVSVNEDLSVPNYNIKEASQIKVMSTERGELNWSKLFGVKPKEGAPWTYENMFMDNLADVRISNPNAAHDEKLLIIKDSFLHAMLPYLAQEFKEIYVIDSRWYRMQFFSAVVREEKPDRVWLMLNDGNLAGESYKYLR